MNTPAEATPKPRTTRGGQSMEKMIGTLIARAEIKAARVTTESGARRFVVVLALLRLAAWYMVAPDLPPVRSISLNHDADSLEEVARYAALHGETPYGQDGCQFHVQLDQVTGLYSPISTSFRSRGIR